MTCQLLCSIVLLATPASAEDPIEGSWICVKAERDGEASEDPVGSTVSFVGGKITIKDPKRDKDQTGSYKLDGSKVPRQITLIPDDDQDAGAKEFLGIYEVKGDELRLCLGGPGAERPTELETKPDSKRMMLTFKRDKPVKDKE